MHCHRLNWATDGILKPENSEGFRSSRPKANPATNQSSNKPVQQQTLSSNWRSVDGGTGTSAPQSRGNSRNDGFRLSRFRNDGASRPFGMDRVHVGLGGIKQKWDAST